MKTIINNILSKKTTYILIMIEVIFSIIYFIFAATNIYSAFKNNIEIPKTFDCDTNFLLQGEIEISTIGIGFQEQTKTPTTNEEKINLVKSLNDNEMIDASTCICCDQNCNIPITNSSLLVDENSYKIKKLPVSDGRTFEKNDFDDTQIDSSRIIPIICGHEIAKKNNIKIGDQIERDEFAEINGFNYEVIGILSRDIKMVDDSFLGFDGGTFPVYNLDNTIILPINKHFIEYNMPMFFYIKYNENNNATQVEDYIKSEFNKIDTQVGIKNPSNVLDNIFDQTFEENKNWLVLSIIILILNIICVTIIISSMVYSRKYEIGIRLAVGYSKKDIIKMLCGELLFINLISYIFVYLSLSIITIINNSDSAATNIVTYTSWEIVLLSFIAVLLFSIASILIIIGNFRKIQPKDMIGGEK